MKFCDKHWQRMLAEVDQAGLGLFISEDPDAVRTNTSTDARAAISSFCPLLMLRNMMVVRAVHLVGNQIFDAEPDGSERCPICFLQSKHDAHCVSPACPRFEDVWPSTATASIRRLAVNTGIMATDQKVPT